MGQVRLIFALTKTARKKTFGDDPKIPTHFAYIEWFSSFRNSGPEKHRGNMYHVKRSIRDGERLVSILPIDRIRRSVSLLPRFGPKVPPGWTSANVLEVCPSFYVNPFSDQHAYITIK